MYPPIGIRIVITVAVTRRWQVARLDVEMAFHQTGLASRNVYVRPPRESRRRGELWLLLVAGYGLFNAGAKWQTVSDEVLLNIQCFGLETVPVIPQLFVRYRDGNVVLVVINIVDDLSFTGADADLKWFTEQFSKHFKLGEIQHGPGKLRFFGLSVIQEDDYTCSIHCDDKLNALESYPLTRIRRRHGEEKLNNIELSAFKSLNSSISWIGTTASPLCAFYSSYLQQRLPNCTLHDLISQSNALSLLKRNGTLTNYPRPKSGTTCSISLVAFADASHLSDRSNLCYLIGLVFGELAQESIFHLLSWVSHKSRRPVHSTPAAEVLAASEALDDLLPLHAALQQIFNVKISLCELVDSKVLYNSLSTQRGSVDKSIRGEVNSIRFIYETALDIMGWIKGSCNPADIGTKPNSPLIEAVILMLATGKITVDLSSQETRSHDRRLG